MSYVIASGFFTSSSGRVLSMCCTAELVVADGASGLEKALAGSLPDVPVQRCIMHAARNVMAKVRARNKAEVGAELRTIWDSSDRAEAMRAFEAFTTKWIVSEERAVRCLAEKIERCLTFYEAHTR